MSIPESLISIGYNAFSGCDNLREAICPAFSISFLPKTQLTIVTISSGRIDYSMFEDCIELENVTIGDDVTFIGRSAFYNCYKLKSVVWNAENCISAGSFDFPIFSGCSNLIDLTIGENVKIIPSCAFYSSKIINLIIGKNVTSIGERAFAGCNKLTNITIPDSVLSIDNYAFSDCNELTNLIIGNNVTSIGERAFAGCNKLTNITIPDSVISISDYAFSDCIGLTNVIIGNSVTSIGAGAFSSCIELKSIIIPVCVTSIGDSAFYKCKGLSNILWDAENCTSAGSSDCPIFYGCPITSLTIGETVKTVPSYAFYDCSNFINVEISASVSYIGNYVFYGGFSKITFKGTTLQWYKISKGNDWRYSANRTCTIYCTDGNIYI